MDPSGKVALITGAAGGLGRAMSKALLAAGAKVVVSDVDPSAGQKFVQELDRQFGSGKALFVKADVTNPAQLEEVFKAAKSTFKRLDIVVNNAGIMRDNVWEKQIDINMKGVVHGMLLGFKYMGKDHGGAGGLIVNVASIAGLGVSTCLPIYSATKHAVIAMTRGYGTPVHVQRTGVHVVALCPGAIDTPLLNDAEQYLLHSELVGDLKNDIKAIGINKPEQIADGLMHIIRHAESGSAWVSDHGNHYQVNFPELLK